MKDRPPNYDVFPPPLLKIAAVEIEIMKSKWSERVQLSALLREYVEGKSRLLLYIVTYEAPLVSAYTFSPAARQPTAGLDILGLV